MTRSDGTQRIFKRYRKDTEVSFFILTKQILASGHVKNFEWQSAHNILIHARSQILTSVKILSPSEDKTFARVDYEHSKYTIKAKASNGKSFKYTTDTFGKVEMGHIKHVDSSDHPPETYKWEKGKLIKYLLPDGRKIRLDYEGFRVSKLILPEGLTYEFEYYNGWTNVTYPDRSKATFYHSDYRVDKIVYYGHKSCPIKTENYLWSENGLLLKKTTCDKDEASLLIAENVYDTRDDLICQKITGSITSEAPTLLTSFYTYDSLHRLIREQTPSGRVIETDYLKSTHLPTQITETHAGTTISRTYLSYDEDHLLISKETDTGCGSSVSFSEHIVRSQSERKIGLPVSIDYRTNGELTLKKSFTYGPYLDVRGRSIFDAKGSYSHGTTDDYDEKGLLVKQRDPFGYQTTFSYDENRNLILEKRPNNLTIKREYDKLGRLLCVRQISSNETQTTSYKYQSSLNPTRITNPDGNQSLYQYDAFGNLINTTLPNGGVIKYSYNPLGHLTSETDPLGHTTSITPNIYGHPLSKTYPDELCETFTYDLDSSEISHIDRKGNETRTVYNVFGSPTQTALYDRYGALLCKTTRRFDALRLVEEIDPEGHKTLFSYDKRNQLLRTERSSRETLFTYDDLGRCNSESCGTYTMRKTFDILSRVTRQEALEEGTVVTRTETAYTPTGLPRHVTRYPGNDKAISEICYDSFDRPIKKIDANGNICTIDYAPNTTTTHYPGGTTTVEVLGLLGKLESYKKYDANHALVEERALAYDAAGNLTSETSGPYNVSYTYTCMGWKKTQLECGSRLIRFTYTPDGQLAKMRKPGGTLLFYTYDSIGHLSRLTSSSGDISYRFVHNNLGHLVSSEDTLTGLCTTRRLDAEGNILEETLANGYSLSYSYDQALRRVSCTLPTGQTISYTHRAHLTSSIAFEDFTHTFEHDLAGNPIAEKTFAGDTIDRTFDPLNRPITLSSPYLFQDCQYNSCGNLISCTRDGNTKRYAYDRADQLIEEPGHTYRYDELHNRTCHNNVSSTYTSLNENIDCVYDGNGYLIDDGISTYEYDSLGRLIRMDEKTFSYDAEHRRLDLIWDHDREIGTLDQLRILDPNNVADYAVAILSQGRTLLPIYDLQHNLTKVFTLSGQLLETRVLSSFGENCENPDVPWTFCGKRMTDKLIYFGARYYSPAQGRFITPDPAGYVDTLNLYTYALNNPLCYFDPNGLSFAEFSNHWLPDISGPPPEQRSLPPFLNYDETSYRQAPSMPEALRYRETFKPNFSREYDLGLPEPEVGRIYFMNGINTSLEDSLEHAKRISEMSGGFNVHLLYNATHGLFADILQAFLGLRYKATNIEKLIIHSVYSYLEDSSEKKALIMSHSHGAIGVRNALHFYPKDEHRKRIFSLATAPGAYINPKDCAQSLALRHLNDPMPTLDKHGSRNYGQTIVNVAPKVPNSFRTHHAFQDDVYSNYHYKLITRFRKEGKILGP